MSELTTHESDITLVLINKRKARKLHADGILVWISMSCYHYHSIKLMIPVFDFDAQCQVYFYNHSGHGTGQLLHFFAVKGSF